MGSRILRASAAAIAWTVVVAGRANPIPADEAAAQAGAGRATAPLALPGASMPLGTPLRADAAPADSMATARDPALLPIDMQGVGAKAHPAPSALPKGPVDDAGADSGDLAKFAHSARDWMNDVFGRPDTPQDAQAAEGLSGGHDDLGLPVETQSSGVQPMAQRAQRPIEVPPPGAGPRHGTAAAAPPRETAGGRLLAESAPETMIQRFLARCREVLVHPLTWLALVAIGATHIVMTRNRRG